MRWANEHPEQMAEIAALPPSQQNAALRAAIGYDPDAIRDRLEEDRIHHRDLSRPSVSRSAKRETPAGEGTPSGPTSAGTTDTDGDCDVCGAPVGKHHLSYCDLRGDV